MKSIVKSFVDVMLYYLTSLDLSPIIIISHMSVVLVLSLIIYMVYKMTFTGVVYAKSFNVSLVIIALVTTMIMMIIRSSVALSLGMVGALSIVRFRTAVKQPKDIAYMFWAIATGLSVGAGAYLLAIVGCIFISVIFIVFKYGKGSEGAYLLVLKGKEEKDEEIEALLDKYTKRNKIRTKNITDEKFEYMFEIYPKMDDTKVMLKAFKGIGLESCNLIAYNNDIGN